MNFLTIEKIKPIRL